jgi:hypothetical protein
LKECPSFGVESDDDAFGVGRLFCSGDRSPLRGRSSACPLRTA